MKTEYKGSIAETTVMHCNSIEQLKIRRPYTMIAIEYHKTDGDPEQVAFFEQELELIDKRIESLGKSVSC